jgi:hypothetical protein
MTNRAILARLLDQTTRAETAGRRHRALTIDRRMTTIAPEHPDPSWERARLEPVDGEVVGRDRLSAMLEVMRDPDLRERVLAILAPLTPE